ncbi:Yip1 family protein [Aliiroseovarius sp. KMU-50]|uniref:Yip1 family protein n=1 Tax=Aliiroseovarius salicola TaxID=3009082 RepID=A0ABT4W357_9RHOB|nr:Yip1 family protein [Aliiroseovarius sp. KMU-50]MDA5094849.1 Yip1 family protein [Aliiroseovarius sp. KMU-50]
MKLEPGYLFGMIVQTIPEPRKVARELFDLPVSRNARWLTLWLLLVAATILGVITHVIYPVRAEQFGPVLASPIALGVFEALFVIIGIFLIYLLGRLAGGQGSIDDAITVAIWLEFVLLTLQVASLVLSLFAPTLAGILMVMSSVLFFWILSHFIAECHGFKSAGLVFAAITTTLVLAILALSFLLALMGVQPPQIGV